MAFRSFEESYNISVKFLEYIFFHAFNITEGYSRVKQKKPAELRFFKEARRVILYYTRKMVAANRFELLIKGSKPFVLPLHYAAVKMGPEA